MGGREEWRVCGSVGWEDWVVGLVGVREVQIFLSKDMAGRGLSEVVIQEREMCRWADLDVMIHE